MSMEAHGHGRATRRAAHPTRFRASLSGRSRRRRVRAALATAWTLVFLSISSKACGERDCRCRGAAVMWRGGRTTSARRTGRSSSGSRAVTVSVGQRGPVRPARFGARYGSHPNKFGGAGICSDSRTGAEKSTLLQVSLVLVSLVMAPRYVARVQPGSGGAKMTRWLE